MIGRVVSVKMKNTVVVLVEYVKTHPLYKKSYTQSKKFLVDDVLGVSLGDVVEIVSTRPISKNKHFKTLKVVGRDIKEIVDKKLQEQAQKDIGEVMPEEEVRGEEQVLSIKDEAQKMKSTESSEKPKKTRVKKEKK